MGRPGTWPKKNKQKEECGAFLSDSTINEKDFYFTCQAVVLLLIRETLPSTKLFIAHRYDMAATPGYFSTSANP